MDAAQRLAEAEAALHELMSGKSVVRVTDQNGETVIYRTPDRQALLMYITDLRRQANTGPTLGPLRVYF